MKKTNLRVLAACALASAAVLAQTAPVAAQDQTEIIRRAVQSAVQTSVSNTIQQSVRRAEAAPTELTNTFFARPQYLSLTTGGFTGGTTGGRTTTNSLIVAPAGVVYNFAPNWFVTGSGTYSHFFSSTTSGGIDTDFFQGDVNLTYVAFHQGMESIRLNADMGIGGIFPSRRTRSTASFNFTPNVDFETGVGNWIFTFTPGFSLAWSDPSGTTDPVGSLLMTGKVLYMAGPWQPQLAVAYTKSVEGTDNTDGTIAVTPEINYVFDRPSLTAGVAYSYAEGLGLSRGITNYSHSAIVNMRLRF